MKRATAPSASRGPIAPLPEGHLRILASAGSGKTYRLATQYLSLLASGAEPQTIFASTFTRAAAGEIRQRILRDLAEAAIEPKRLNELAQRLNVRKSLTRDDVVALLQRLATSLHRVQVRTLDSFFGAIAQTFALDLGLPSGFQPLDPAMEAALREQAIAVMLDEQDPMTLVRTLRSLTQGAEDRSVAVAISREVAGLSEVFRQSTREAWEHLRAMPTLDEGAVRAAVETLASVTQGDGHVKKGLAPCKKHAQSHDWDSFLETGLVRRVVQGHYTYYNKQLPVEVVSFLQPVAAHAVGVVNNRLMDANQATWRLLDAYHAHFDRLTMEAGQLTFADVTRHVSTAVRSHAQDDVLFRLDSSLHHVLLDEMQDTSAPQWDVLEPLLRELLSHRDRTLFCVGDVKQCIYTWREAVPQILQSLPDLLGTPGAVAEMRTERLATSYRSSQVVLDAVNRVFSFSPDNAALNTHAQVQAEWNAGFERHTAKHAGRPGYVALIQTATAPEDTIQKVFTWQRAAAVAADVEQRLPAGQTIAVLTRTNPAARRIMFELLTQHHVDATSSGGADLTAVPAVNTVLDVLRLADHPDDTVCAFNVAHSPLGPTVGLLRHDDARARKEAARTIRKRLLREGFADTIAGLLPWLASACDARDMRRLQQLVRLAGRFDTTGAMRPDAFVRFVEQTRVQEAGGSRVQVMTVHQAKGLEFDAVVLTDMEGRLTGSRTAAVAFERDGSVGPISRICRHVKKELLEVLPGLKKMFRKHEDRVVRESLCVLYVSMTRAKSAVHMVISPPSAREKTIPATSAGILRAALASGSVTGDAEAVLYAEGDSRWMERSEAERAERRGPSTRRGAAHTSLPATEPTSRWKRRADMLSVHLNLAPSRGGAGLRGLVAPSPSTLAMHDEEAGIAPGTARFARRFDDSARMRGLVIHALFQQVTWLDRWQADDPALMRVIHSAMPEADDRRAKDLLDEFLVILKRPAVAAALSLGKGDGGLSPVLRREQPFARMVDGRLQTGVIDRLVIAGDQAADPVAVVIDYKTDDIAVEDAPRHAERYRAQMDAYRNAAAAMLGVVTKRVRTSLLFVTPGVMVPVANAAE